MSTSAESPRDEVPPAGSTAPGAPRPLLDVLRIGVVILDPGGRILLWSPVAERVLGWPDSLVLGRPVTDFVASPCALTGGAGNVYRELLRTGSWRGVIPLRHLDGRTVEVEGRGSLMRRPDGSPFVLANLVETSLLAGIEQELAALDALFTASPLGIALFDTEQRFVRVNESLSRLCGVGPQDLIDRTVLEVLPDHMGPQIDAVQREVLASGHSVIDLVTLSPDRRGARSVSFGRLTDRTGRVHGVSCTVMDITERREATEKIERARQRLALLDDIGAALGDLLEVAPVADSLAHLLVPRFCDYAGVMLPSAFLDGDGGNGDRPRHTPLVQAAVAAKRHSPEVDRMLGLRETVRFTPESVFGKVLAGGRARLLDSAEAIAEATSPDDPKVTAATGLGIHSLMVVPLRARGKVLGLLVISRAGRRAGFDADDLALAEEIAGRASVSLDNARLYAREREAAVMLQRSLLPQTVPEPPGVRIGFRYVPGSSRAEVGGDWFDVIPLAGGRVAFVVGDVMGHGLRAAATMGRLRTAVRTLADLDLPPAELLERVNRLSDDLAAGPDDPMMATCLYAVHDPATGECAIAKAGHVPPVLVTREEATGRLVARPVDVPDGPPIGLPDTGHEEIRAHVPAGSVLVLYTDGLIEKRGEDITDGLDRLCETLTGPGGGEISLEKLCDTVLDALVPEVGRPGHGAEDDIALLAVQLGELSPGDSASWVFPARGHSVRRARSAVRHTLRDWGLSSVEDSVVLLVSELVTNALRYAHGPIGVRLVRGGSLLVEVSDPLPDPPLPRRASPEEENGRGLHLVSLESHRWGTRRDPAGKTVWFEVHLPDGPPGPTRHRTGR
ncbi:SpoIIE family protein phosphatase [Streptomyces sp. ST2-7A]|uniref:SpoIIE family protein phosphatase n=1 Tax=Streptomyces sp. ST2-7A TaxID=2907214 RepID=UPI001F3C19A3|nr:SpoIIE family protein phosphatase [Streptomyces sp. ST2-7A]MCE7082138.1 SpoIIE family protein phosphatase [Streptomyces sp. ST2-7A]